MERQSGKQDHQGAIYRVQEGDSGEVYVVETAAFDPFVQSLGNPMIQSGAHFRVAISTEGGHQKVVIANLVPVKLNDINQDNAYPRRREAADVLYATLQRASGITRKMRSVTLPSLVQIYSCFEAITDKSIAHVMRTCTSNTQGILDAQVEAFLNGPQRDDLWRDVNLNTRDRNFKHTDLFGRIFTEQIRIMEHAVQCNPDCELVVVDLGCSRGHGILTLSRYAANRGFIDRLRFVGIDNNESDLTICRELLAEVPGVRADLIKDDIGGKGFADRLRRLHPDIVLGNHVLEHLWAEDVESDFPASQRLEVMKNRYLHPWLFAARKALSISVPLDDDLETSISDHVRVFSRADLQHLAESMPLRCALAVKTLRLDQTLNGGLCSWVRDVERDAFRGPYLRITPRSQSVNRGDEAFLGDFTERFDPNQFRKAHLAQKVADIKDRTTFASEGGFPHQVRQLLIKVPGRNVRLPIECNQFGEAVQLIVDHNKTVNPFYEDSYAYFNMFRGKTTFSKYRGLSLNPHGDQLQTLLDGFAYPSDWSYIVSNCVPTMIFEHAFNVSDAVKRARAGERVNLYDVFADQLQFDRMRYTTNFSIYLLSPYVVHSASESQEAVHRVFMKIAFSTKRYVDNREFRHSSFDYDDWFEKDTLTYADGFFQHAHWNECYLAEDVVPNGLATDAEDTQL